MEGLTLSYLGLFTPPPSFNSSLKFMWMIMTALQILFSVNRYAFPSLRGTMRQCWFCSHCSSPCCTWSSSPNAISTFCVSRMPWRWLWRFNFGLPISVEWWGSSNQYHFEHFHLVAPQAYTLDITQRTRPQKAPYKLHIMSSHKIKEKVRKFKLF